jgi:RHS repeat-associated protein
VGTNPPNTPVTTSYDASGLPVSSSDNSGYSFDPVGNLLTISGTRTWTFTYDSWNRTKTAVGGGGSPPSITYTSDALDRMTKRVRNDTSTTTNYSYIGTGEDPASQVTGANTTMYAYDLGGPVAQSAGGTVRVYVPNLHGDTALVADTSQTVTGTQAYKPYGERGAATGTNAYFGFQSDPTDADTGFVDMGTRLYDPVMGRFSTRDVLTGEPTAPMSLNQYVYGADSPVSMTDPDGMCYRDPDNVSGCGYTITTKAKKGNRYDMTFGWGSWRPLTGINGFDAVPPPPPHPPAPTKMLGAARLGAMEQMAQRTSQLVAINTDAELDTDSMEVFRHTASSSCTAYTVSCSTLSRTMGAIDDDRLSMRQIGRAINDHRWEIASVAVGTVCVLAPEGCVLAAGALAAAKTASSIRKYGLTKQGGVNVACGLVTSVLTAVPGYFVNLGLANYAAAGVGMSKVGTAVVRASGEQMAFGTAWHRKLAGPGCSGSP